MLPRVLSRVSRFPVASPCLWGKLRNMSFSKVSKQVVMLFCVAGAALCDIPTCLITCRKSFFVAGAILLRRFHKMSCSCRGGCSMLEISVVIFVAGAALHTPHFTLYTPPFTLHTPHFTLYTPHSTLHPLHFTLHTMHTIFPALHFILYPLHSTLHTLHFTLHTLHSAFHTPPFTLHTLHSTLYSLHSILYTSHFTLHTSHATLTLHFALYTLHSALYTLKVQDCFDKLFQKGVLHDSISMCFDICTTNIRVSIRVPGLHLVSSKPRYVKKNCFNGFLVLTHRVAKVNFFLVAKAVLISSEPH